MEICARRDLHVLSQVGWRNRGKPLPRPRLFSPRTLFQAQDPVVSCELRQGYEKSRQAARLLQQIELVAHGNDDVLKTSEALYAFDGRGALRGHSRQELG